jgi:hypothetical protein
MNKIIYCLVSVKTNHEKLNVLLVGMKGISGENLSVITFDKITAVVSDIKDTNIIADRSNAIKFAEVIETLVQQFTLLPVRYGSIMEATSINKMIERNYQEFQRNLQKVENKVEYGLKVFCDSEKLKLELSAKSEENIQKPEKPSQNIKNSVYRDYINKKHKEHNLEELLLAYVDMIIQEITKHLEQLNPIHTFKKMESKTNIINAVFLLEKDKKEGLINIVKDIQNNYTGLNLMLTGPWPPYNFVDITIK